MNMQQPLVSFCLAFIAVLLGSSFAFAQKATGTQAEFDLSVEGQQDLPPMETTGTASIREELLRVDFTHPLTLEPVVMLVDQPADLLVVLYPDTLNGEQYQISAFDHLDGFSAVAAVLTGEDPVLPEHWQREPPQDTDSGAVHHMATNGTTTIDWWVDADGQPLRARAAKGHLAIEIAVTKYSSIELEPSLFAVPDDYYLGPLHTDSPEDLPSL
jgi:hypothetical protein